MMLFGGSVSGGGVADHGFAAVPVLTTG